MERFHKFIKKYFFPHEENEYKPHLLRHEATLLFFFLIILIELVFLFQVLVVFDKTKFLAAVLPGVLTSLANEERAQYDAPPLKENPLLDKAAQLKAEDMAALGYFAHTSPEGKTPWYWFDQVGYRYAYAGENLAVNFFESEDVANAWMDSPTHRANIIKKDYTEIGIGVASGVYEGRNTVFVAQLFAKPLAVAPAPVAPEPTPTPVVKEAPAPTPTKPVTPTKTVLPKPIVTPTQVATPVVSPSAVTVLGEESSKQNVVAGSIAKGQSSIKAFINKVLSSPRQYVSYFYGGIALLVILVLLLMLFIKTELRHPAILARGMVLMGVIVLLSYINLSVISTGVEVTPEGGLSATALEALSQ